MEDNSRTSTSPSGQGALLTTEPGASQQLQAPHGPLPGPLPRPEPQLAEGRAVALARVHGESPMTRRVGQEVSPGLEMEPTSVIQKGPKPKDVPPIRRRCPKVSGISPFPQPWVRPSLSSLVWFFAGCQAACFGSLVAPLKSLDRFYPERIGVRLSLCIC